MKLNLVLEWYKHLTPESLSKIGIFYHEDAHFRDPFNNVHGKDRIMKIFLHMFKATEKPVFHIKEAQQIGPVAWITWIFSFRLRGKKFAIEGATRMEFDEDGLVLEHHDYWDSMDLLVEFPWIGKALAKLRKKFRAPQQD